MTSPLLHRRVRSLEEALDPAYDALDEQQRLADELKNSPYLDNELRTEKQVRAEKEGKR